MYPVRRSFSFHHQRSGILDRPPSRAMTAEYTSAFSRRDAPELAGNPANLTPASGRQDHTTSPYATITVRHAPKARATTSRPPHPIPRKMTTMIRPSFGTGRRKKELICARCQAIFGKSEMMQALAGKSA
jgi:hypothetical protein